jgi:hypothetical protein
MVNELFTNLSSLFRKERPVTHEVNGDSYAVKADGTLGEYVRKPLPTPPIAAPTLNLMTLTGFVDACKAKIDAFPEATVAVQIGDYRNVRLVSLMADEHGRRHVWLEAVASNENPFAFETYIEPEPFLISLQKGFAPSQNTAAIAAMCSKVKVGDSITVADDGFSQVVTMQEGAIERGKTQVPNRLPLAPYRTFREIEPIHSDFMLRMKAVKDQLPRFALLEVDGGKWKLDTVLAIAAWLRTQLPDIAVIA